MRDAKLVSADGDSRYLLQVAELDLTLPVSCQLYTSLMDRGASIRVEVPVHDVDAEANVSAWLPVLAKDIHEVVFALLSHEDFAHVVGVSVSRNREGL